jgi:3',5'-nucleoside bisphosphate phosphatase
VVRRAGDAGLSAVALTDHDTLAGIPEALAAGERYGVRVVAGCEFSVAAPWGEMHVLGYLLPSQSAELEAFLERCRADRVRRAREMVNHLQRLGLDLSFENVLQESDGAAVGRPHVARALVRHAGGGVVSIAHLKERGTREIVERFKGEGLDAIETRHPSHDPDLRARLTDIAIQLGLLRTGGSDWHGDPEPGSTHGAMGSQQVPREWLDRLDEWKNQPQKSVAS